MHIKNEHIATRLLITCVLIEIALLILDATINYYRFTDSGPVRRLFNMAREDGLASWFMVLQTGFACLIVAAIGVIRRDREAPDREVRGWFLISAFFLYLSADDGAKIHERLGSLFGSYASDPGLANQIAKYFPSYSWHIVVLPLLVLCGCLMIYFLWNQMNTIKSKRLLILAPAIMALAVVLDFIEGLDKNHAWNLQVLLSENTSMNLHAIRHFSKSLEEFFEMLAITLLLYLFVQKLIRVLAPSWTVTVTLPDHKD